MSTGEILIDQRARDIVAGLPMPDYSVNYQPTYPDQERLVEGVHELINTEAVTTPRQIDALSARLAGIATGTSQERIGLTGYCAEPVRIDPATHSLEELEQITIEMAQGIMATEEIVAEAGLVFISRSRNQSAKPRSAETETLSDGKGTVPSYMGDIINGKGPYERAPDPSRMVSTALQSRDVEAALTELAGHHISAAHEALLLPFEEAFIHIDPETGKEYLLSADMPWIGVRTNDPEGPHVALISRVENPAGVKLGPNTTAAHVAALKAKLNPNDVPGKLTFMLRMGLGNTDVMDATLEAIKDKAPGSLIMYDIHGSTQTIVGKKIRAVSHIVEEVAELAALCAKHGLQLHGVHLESTPDSNRRECVDTPDQIPADIPDVDPLLNPGQLQAILKGAAPYLLTKTVSI